MPEWINHGEKLVSETKWFRLMRADVEVPDGRHLDHYLMRMNPVVMTACVAGGRVLMIYRHRFIPEVWGWELPSGGVEPGEGLAAAAARETLEETGWRPGPLHRMLSVVPSPGFSDAIHHVYLADGAELVGAPTDAIESDRIEWVPLAEVPAMIGRGEITSGSTIAGVLAIGSVPIHES